MTDGKLLLRCERPVCANGIWTPTDFLQLSAGHSSPWGIPTWCNYNNRGQAVCSFGVQDKDHAILEFTAAAAAYQRTPLTGFRTFLKENGKVTEAFAAAWGP